MATARPNPAMARIREQKEYERGLKDGEKKAGDLIKAVANGTEDKPLTLADVQKMGVDDVNRRWTEVSEVLARSEAFPEGDAA
jgi:hypothetical protein